VKTLNSFVIWAVASMIGAVPMAGQAQESQAGTPPATQGLAEEQAAEGQALTDSLPAPVIDENAESSRVLMDKIEVIGTVAKPQALFILPGRDPKVDGIEIDRSFFRDIFRPIEKDYHPINTRRYVNGQMLW